MQKNDNFIHSSARNIVERAYGVLKARFASLRFVDMTDEEMIWCYQLILSSCVLHNLAINFKDDFDEEFYSGDDSELNCLDAEAACGKG